MDKDLEKRSLKYLQQMNFSPPSNSGGSRVRRSPPYSPSADSSDYDLSSFTEIMTTKCSLEAELNAAMQVNNQLQNREKFLTKKISELNHQADLSLQLLENKKNELLAENSSLKDALNALPPLRQLEAEYFSLNNYPIDDPEPLRELGILTDEEDLSSLDWRLRELLDELRILEDEAQTPFFASYFDEEDQTETDLRRKISLLEKSSESSMQIAKKKLNKLSMEVEMLKRQYTANQNESKHKSFIKTSISKAEVKSVIRTANGNVNELKQIDSKTFSYNDHTFSIEMICGRPYVQSDGQRVPLLTYIKIIARG